jgi:hypothetical protein
MRTRVLLGVVAALAAVLVAAWMPAANGGEVDNSFTVVKEVVGPVPPGSVFEVEVECQNQGGAPDEGANGGTVTFDEDGNPTSPNTLDVGLFTTCTATETVTNGAAVSYACAVSGGDNAPEGDSQVACEDDQTVSFGEILGANGTITVTNTFEEEPPPPPPPPDVEPDDVVPDVVNATPPFTG